MSSHPLAVLSSIILCSITANILGLKLNNLDVPAAVMQGDGVWLNCTLDLETDELYSVKWYKDDVEFYRFLPRDNPSGQKYDLEGVYVDLEKSGQGNVHLWKTDLQTEGIYRCEASAESPTFQTVEGEKQITVYVLPQEGPTIQGSKPWYEIGDNVNITCRSGPSKPAAILKWFINGKEAPQEFVIPYMTQNHSSGLEASFLGLTFEAGPVNLFQGNAISLRCTATVYHTYSMASKELIIGNKSIEDSSTSVSPRDGPMIIGGKMNYRIGDVLDVNCSSAKSSQPSELHWFINEEKAEEDVVIKYTRIHYPDGSESSLLGLRFKVAADHFDENDEMRLKCTATLSKVINMRSNEKVVGGNHGNADFHVTENAGKVSSRSGCRSTHFQVFSSSVLLAVSAVFTL